MADKVARRRSENSLEGSERQGSVRVFGKQEVIRFLPVYVSALSEARLGESDGGNTEYWGARSIKPSEGSFGAADGNGCRGRNR